MKAAAPTPLVLSAADDAVATRQVANAARLSLERVEYYCRIAGQAGWSSRLDRLATVLLAANDAPARRGPQGNDPMAARCWRHSPNQQRAELARLRNRLRLLDGVDQPEGEHDEALDDAPDALLPEAA